MAPYVSVVQHGRDGHVTYHDGAHSITGYQEFGGGDVVAIVSMGSDDDWRVRHGWAIDRRADILRFVATFIGSPPMNVLEGPVAAGIVARWTGRALGTGAALGVRPHDLELGPARASAVTATVDLVETLGHAAIVHVATAEGARLVAVVSGAGVARGDSVSLDASVGCLHWFDGRGIRQNA